MHILMCEYVLVCMEFLYNYSTNYCSYVFTETTVNVVILCKQFTVCEQTVKKMHNL